MLAKYEEDSLFFHERNSATTPMSVEARLFVERGIGLKFEMRFIGEDRWWPCSVDDIARTLEACQPSLQIVFGMLCAGAIVASPLCEFRLVEALTDMVA